MKLKDTRGAIVLESTYCTVIAILMLFFLMSYGFFLYQRTMVYVAANQIAEEVGQTYKLCDVENASGVTAEDVAGVGNFRYTLRSGSFKSKNISKCLDIAGKRLMQGSLAKDEGGLQVEVKQLSDGWYRQHYEITVSKKYSLLLGKMLSVIQQKDVQTMSTTVYVESVDVLNYTNSVRLEKFALNETKEVTALANIVNNILGTFGNLEKIFDSL